MIPIEIHRGKIMAAIKYRFIDGRTQEIQVSDKLATAYADIEYREQLSERRERRRHQSLEKSMEHGFDIPDFSADINMICERHELSDKLYTAIKLLTGRQRIVFILHTCCEQPFRVIGERLGLGTYTVRDYYYNAVKKLKKFLS